MKIDIKPGKYILAVSGGVDSMVLLDLLRKKPELDLVVAHFDHGIRDNSYTDAELVKKTARGYGLEFELGEGKLGKGTSEETARDARYKFLEKIKTKYKADGIITAHQQDDVIETALINILRGTSPMGIIAITANKKLTRPLLSVSKAEILKYAKANKLIWHEDETNADTKYLRNYIRKNVTSKLSDAQKIEIFNNIDKVAKIQKTKNETMDKIASKLSSDGKIDRQLFALLPSNVGAELVAKWMRESGFRQFDKKMVDKVNQLIRTALPGTKHDLSKNFELVIEKFYARFK